MRKILAIFILAQLVLIGYLIVRINNQASLKVLGSKTSISVIDKNSINLKPDSNLKYFWDMKPDSIAIENPNWLEKNIVHPINHDALNDRYNYSIDKQKDTYRIVTLGDSFTFGQNVSTENNWTELLEDKLNNNFKCEKYNKFEVINLGVKGYDIQYAVERYKIRGQKYNPDLIVWMLADKERISEIILNEQIKCETKDPDHTLDAVGGNICYNQAKNKLINDIGQDNINNILQSNFNQIFLYYKNKILTVDLNNQHDNIIPNHKNVKNLIIEYFKIDKYKFPDFHPNEKGHQYFADKIFEYIKNEKLIPCD